VGDSAFPAQLQPDVGGDRAIPGTEPLDPHGIAVLPFENFTRDPKRDEYLVDGMATSSSTLSGTSVACGFIAWMSVRQYKESARVRVNRRELKVEPWWKRSGVDRATVCKSPPNSSTYAARNTCHWMDITGV